MHQPIDDNIILSYDDMSVSLKPGDKVDCRIKDSKIVSPYRSYDEVRTFEIVAEDEYGYWLYVPHYLNLKETVVADKIHCRDLGIDKRFLNENIILIQDNQIANIQERLDGKYCVICGEFYQYAAGNQPDGALICYSCRQNPYR